MEWLHRWLRATPARAPEGLQALRAETDAFVNATLAEVDRVALDRSVARQRRALAYFFGALHSLAEVHNADETAELAVAVQLVGSRFAASAAELGSVTALRADYAADIEMRALLREGAEAVARWRQGSDPQAARRLRELLALS